METPTQTENEARIERLKSLIIGLEAECETLSEVLEESPEWKRWLHCQPGKIKANWDRIPKPIQWANERFLEIRTLLKRAEREIDGRERGEVYGVSIDESGFILAEDGSVWKKGRQPDGSYKWPRIEMRIEP